MKFLVAVIACFIIIAISQSFFWGAVAFIVCLCIGDR